MTTYALEHIKAAGVSHGDRRFTIRFGPAAVILVLLVA
jgi:hypothetical protein